MKLARVRGTVVCTQKHASVKDLTMLLVQPLDDGLNNSGGPIVAIDTAQAGPGDLVHLTLSREATLALPNPYAPVDAAITGIVDAVDVENVKMNKGIFVKHENSL